MPKVSVVIPAYNYAQYTVDAVNSVLQQTYRDYEIIVVDDGSTDDTRVRLQPFITNQQIKYIYQKNQGAAHARNTGIKNASGEYIALLDCDDLYLPAKLEICINWLECNSEVGLVYTPVLFMDESGKLSGKDREACYSGRVFNKLILDNFIRNSTPVIRRQCFDKAGLFDESLFYTADWDMWLRIAERFAIIYIAQPLSKYRRRESDYFTKNTEVVKSEMLRVVEKVFNNNSVLAPKAKSKILAQISLWTVKVYLGKAEYAKARAELTESLRLCPYKAESYLMKLLLIPGDTVHRLVYQHKRLFNRIKWH